MLSRLIILPALLLLLTACSEDVPMAIDHPLNAVAESLEWNWFDVEGMICRDESETGLGVRLGADPTKWAFFLQGGGACFTESTCASNPSSFSINDFESRVQQGFYDGGILNNERTENPLKGWNIVFVPYCTGDVHSGDNEDSFGLGISEAQQFVGSRNIQAALKWLKPYAEANGVDEFVVSGISAGGFGTHLTYFAVKDVFGDIPTTVINDSGPLFNDQEVFPLCLQTGFLFIYNLPLPPGFAFCCQPTQGLADIYTLSANLYPNDNFGLMSHLEDDVIRFFYAGGQNDCSGGEISGPLFEQGLINLRDDVLIPTNRISTYYAPGETHTFIQGDNSFYNTSISGKPLVEWVSDVMNGTAQHID